MFFLFKSIIFGFVIAEIIFKALLPLVVAKSNNIVKSNKPPDILCISDKEINAIKNMFRTIKNPVITLRRIAVAKKP